MCRAACMPANCATLNSATIRRMRRNRGNSSISTPSVKARSAMEAVEPRSGANEDPANKPIRSVVAVGRARVRIIVVISVRANRRSTDYHRAHTDSHRNPNRRGLRQGRNQQAKTQ